MKNGHPTPPPATTVSLHLHFDGRSLDLTPADRESREWLVGNATEVAPVLAEFHATWIGRPIRTSVTTDVAAIRALLLSSFREAFPEQAVQIVATMAWTETVQTTRRVP